jgi:hypothetical protein
MTHPTIRPLRVAEGWFKLHFSVLSDNINRNATYAHALEPL